MNKHNITLTKGTITASLSDTQHLQFFKDEKTGALVVQAFDRTEEPSYCDPDSGIALTTKTTRPEKMAFEVSVTHILERDVGFTLDDLLAEGEQQLKYTTLAFGNFVAKALPFEETTVSCVTTDCNWRSAEPEDESGDEDECLTFDMYSAGHEFTFEGGHVIRARKDGEAIEVTAFVDGVEKHVARLRPPLKLYSVTFTIPTEFTITVAAEDDDAAESLVHELGRYDLESAIDCKDGEFDYYNIEVTSVDYEGDDTDSADITAK